MDKYQLSFTGFIERKREFRRDHDGKEYLPEDVVKPQRLFLDELVQ